MTNISDMDLPDEVVEKAHAAFMAEPEDTDDPGAGMTAALRAALQAMVDCGMAEFYYRDEKRGTFFDPKFTDNNLQDAKPILIIRLDADERKAKERS